MATDLQFMQRCIQLAQLGAGHVAPNPMVGAVVVHNGRIIGEGYHERYGGPHAEVNAIASVAEEDRPLLKSSTMYVSLEPCAHFGKTPPCSDLIIHTGIPEVVVGIRDPFPAVDGKGIEKLTAAGVKVRTGVGEDECRFLNRRFFGFHQKQRPYIILKWAQTANGKVDGVGEDRLLISDDLTNRLVHRWRSEEAAIMVGRKTVEKDDPLLDNRLWTGNSPIRVVIDADLRLSPGRRVFRNTGRVVILNGRKDEVQGNLHFKKTDFSNFAAGICRALYEENVLSVLIEGGPETLQSFMVAGLWDEARVITNTSLHVSQGLDAPKLSSGRLSRALDLGSDRIDFYTSI